MSERARSTAPFWVARVVALPVLAAAGGELAEAVSVGLVPAGGGSIAWGDCLAASTAGRGGAAPDFSAAAGLAAVERILAPALVGRAVFRFREAAGWLEALRDTAEEERPLPVADLSRRALLTAPLRAMRGGQGSRAPTERVMVDRPLHPAVLWGASQALLQAAAQVQGLTAAEVIAAEWGLPPARAVPLHAYPGADLDAAAEEMIGWRLPSLPHLRIDDAPAQLGQDGAVLTRTIRRLRERIVALPGEEYRPVLHFDLRGALGRLCGDDPGKMLGHLYGWEAAAKPCRLRIEDPMIHAGRAGQVGAMRTLRDYVRARRMRVQLVANAWAETPEGIRAFVEAGAADGIRINLPAMGSLASGVEALLACKAAGVQAFVGGCLPGTLLSARIALHVALCCGADLLGIASGASVDEAVSLAQAEMARALREMELRRDPSRDPET